MTDWFYAPIIVALLLGTLTQLEDLGEEASQKTIDYAEQAVNAIDCAYQARPLTECSPDLFNADFTAEIEETNRLLEEIQNTLEQEITS